MKKNNKKIVFQIKKLAAEKTSAIANIKKKLLI